VFSQRSYDDWKTTRIDSPNEFTEVKKGALASPSEAVEVPAASSSELSDAFRETSGECSTDGPPWKQCIGGPPEHDGGMPRSGAFNASVLAGYLTMSNVLGSL